tara:strand:+ start:2380 stop:3606 length:1227 start_codon:yes stop_codon:yes gene_type:complete
MADPININSLYSDILPDPAAELRQQQSDLLSVLNTTGGVAALNAPRQSQQLRYAAGGLFGVDTRTEPEKMREQLGSAMQDTSPTGMIKLANLIQQSNPEKALELRATAAQQERQQQLAKLEAERQQSYRNTVANRAANSPRFRQDVTAIVDGTLPQTELDRIYSELTKEEEIQDLEPLQLILPDGTQQTAFYDDKGSFYDVTDPTKKLKLEEGTQVLRSSQVGGATDYSNPQEIALRQAHLDTSQFVSSVNNVVKALEDNPDANTAAGQVAGVINNIIQEAEAVINLNEKGGRKKLIDKLELGRVSSEMQSMLIGLAYQAAKAEGQKGRDVSNADIERFMRQLGANSSDPEAIKNNVRRLSKEAQIRFNDRYLFTRNQKWEGSFEPITPAPSGEATPPVPAGNPDPYL